MESLEDELRYFHKEYIKLTTICPAAIETGFSKTVETRFPRLFPVMQPDHAADAIIDSILREQRFLTIPFGYNVLYIILLRLPRCIRYLIIDYIGSTAQPNRDRNHH
jgi:all-trans-retinol dehydrogenase (NAD+)